MTRSANARLAGFTFLFYIATAMASMATFERAAGAAGGIAGKLASIARHAPDVRLTVFLTMLTVIEALVLAVTLYALTREEDPDLALLALSCRLLEGMLNAVLAVAMLALLWIAAGDATGAAAASAFGAMLLKLRGWGETVGATVFSFGSTLYCYLFLRARTIPVPLAALGLGGSVLVAIALSAQLAGYAREPMPIAVWLPLLVFEVTLGFWLLIKGVAAPRVAAVRMG